MRKFNTWLVDGRVALGYYEGVITIEDLQYSQEEAEALYDTVDSRVIHGIIDMRHMTEYPTNLAELIRVISIFRNPRLGWIMLITNNTIVRFLSSAVVQLSQARFRTFTNVEQCLEFLEDVDETLPIVTIEAYNAAVDRVKNRVDT